jgi:hypothetical protein
MSVSEYKFPNVVSTEAIVGAVDWTDPDNVKASDDTYATCAGKKTYWLKCLSYIGFTAAIATTARIVGIEVAIEGKPDGIAGGEVYLCYKGKRIGTNRAHDVEWNSIESTYVYGGSWDVWGLNLTPAMVKDITFGVHIALEGDGTTISIDSVSMQVSFITIDDTEVQICNEALGKCGEPAITSLAGTDVRSKACALHYDSVRSTLLSSHIWQFATVQAKLERSPMPPLFNWAYSYELPSNFLKTSDIWPEMTKYAISAGNVIHTNISDGSIRYIANVIDPTLFTKDFREAFVYKLALALHPALVDKISSYRVLQKEALLMIRTTTHRGTVHQRPSRNTMDWTTELRI